MTELVLPRTTAALISRVRVAERHPGLQLDKYSVPGEQAEQKGTLARVCDAAGDNDLLAALMRRRENLFNSLPSAEGFSCQTTGPLTLHLSRASALENAGLCLHPLYGFVYLPGTGLKGMARAYAKTVAGASTAEIAAVFGHDVGENAPEQQHAGAIVFHDAWPEQWPRLIVDIVNNHHPDYYQAKPNDNTRPAGDWENPKPVYFLAVPPGATFRFALSLRRRGGRTELLSKGKEWLLGALCYLGAGAKTAAGYGSFRPVHQPAPALPSSRARFEATLELVTPAFLAGACQQKEDCDLRPATLRGLLRWWWRTMHAGFVDVATLREMEAAVWGDVCTGGAVALTLTPLTPEQIPQPCPFKRLVRDRRDRDELIFDAAFAREHKLALGPPRQTQGLAYAAYGMDEMGGRPRQRRRRWYAPAGMQWRVGFVVRPSRFNGRLLDQELLLEQAKLALWWLSFLGGVGSKARNGFGSFADPPALADFNGVRWLSLGKPFRAACGLPEEDFDPGRIASPALGQMRNLASSLSMNPCLHVHTKWRDPWRVLDAIGASMQSFAQAKPSTGHGKHCDAKRHLGLPRKIHGPLSKPLPHQSGWQAPLELQGICGDRHASPVWYHVAKGQGGLTIRVGAFPTANTRAPEVASDSGWRESRDLLEGLLLHLQQDLTSRAVQG